MPLHRLYKCWESKVPSSPGGEWEQHPQPGLQCRRVSARQHLPCWEQYSEVWGSVHFTRILKQLLQAEDLDFAIQRLREGSSILCKWSLPEFASSQVSRHHTRKSWDSVLLASVRACPLSPLLATCQGLASSVLTVLISISIHSALRSLWFWVYNTFGFILLFPF